MHPQMQLPPQMAYYAPQQPHFSAPNSQAPAGAPASPTNGGGGSGSGGKRARTGDSGAASAAAGPVRTLHVRNVPMDCTEPELHSLVAPFGAVTSISILRGKGQAFVQMQDPAAAARILQYFTTNVPQIRGRACFWQLSNRDTHTAPGSPGAASAPNSYGFSGAPSSPTPTLPPSETPSQPILLLTITNLMYPVTIETLHSIFSRFGRVAKIVIFSKSQAFQAFIQFEEMRAAAEARAQLEGQNLYPNCNTLRLQFSLQSTQLNVKFNSDKHRDYTNDSLPQLAPMSPHHAVPMQTSLYPAPPTMPIGLPSAVSYGNMAGVPMGMAPMYPSPHGNVLGMTAGLSALSMANMPMGAHGLVPGGARSLPPMPPTQLAADPMAAAGGIPGSCVIVASLSERTTPDELFNLFGQYGDIIRVKILYNKRDTALIQLSTAAQADSAIAHLNACPLHGQSIQVSHSRHSFIALSRADLETPALARDYTGSPHHRFRNPTSRNFAFIIAPTALLHVMGLPDDISDEAIRQLFTPYGALQSVKIFQPKERKMALVQMSSVPDAVQALIHLHLSKYRDHVLRVSFSKGNPAANLYPGQPHS